VLILVQRRVIYDTGMEQKCIGHQSSASYYLLPITSEDRNEKAFLSMYYYSKQIQSQEILNTTRLLRIHTDAQDTTLAGMETCMAGMETWASE
jgi:hypothetical protein